MKLGVAVSVALTVVHAANAQTPAARPKLEPTAQLLQGMCVPWLGGMDAKKMADGAAARGFKPQWIGEKLGGMLTPDALLQQGWAGVHFGETRMTCGISMAWVGSSPLDAISADVENWLAGPAPGKPWTRKLDVWKNGEPGKAERSRVWESPTHELSVVETPDAMLSEMNEGKLAVSLGVYLRKK